MQAKRILLFLICAALWSGGAVRAQDTVATPANEAGNAVDDAPEAGDDPGTTDTDAESYLDIEEDDFRPSEEIPADQSIDFPVDI